ncbi:xanthine dehydrogenase [Bacillus cereus]|nr:xanthine dehydrogenase [Bacillus cereus]PEW62131.1 xanthine dehydrogenase [Bacillus cereus]PEY98229.1 xanthine dehydrogenase [Bacillus cereus]PFC15776.1 xanthine dehydrogenase [Bacillus cereus]PFD17166.1 xanthine dehydrogenase [Bacillus cereus]
MMADIHDIIEAAISTPQNCTLAPIIRVAGSSYRKEGSMMVFGEDGIKVGMLSAGCIEEELYLYSKEISNEKWSIHEFDMREENDLSWGVGCNGIIYILLEKVNYTYQEYLRKVRGYTEKGVRVWMIKNLAKSKTLFISEEGDEFGDWEGKVPVLSELKKGWYEDLYVHYFEPRPKLFIIGAGEDAKPLISLAKETGFFVTVCDWREGLCTPLRFPEADRCVVGFPKEIMSRISIKKQDFIMIMTHHFTRDQELLSLLQNHPCRYLGILGSRYRTARLLGGVDKPKWIFSPAGLSIGAEGPNEIAISIMAEMIQIMRMKNDENSRNISSGRKE